MIRSKNRPTKSIRNNSIYILSGVVGQPMFLGGRGRNIASGFLAAVLVIALAVGLLRYLDQTTKRPVVPKGPGALMAVDADGLRELHALYARPKICGDANYRKSTDFVAVHQFCDSALPITQDALRKGVVLLPGGARAVSVDTRYILADGDFAASSYSPVSNNGMIRDGAVKVEYVRLSHPLDNNTEGWVVSGYLQCECGPFP